MRFDIYARRISISWHECKPKNLIKFISKIQDQLPTFFAAILHKEKAVDLHYHF